MTPAEHNMNTKILQACRKVYKFETVNNCNWRPQTVELQIEDVVRIPTNDGIYWLFTSQEDLDEFIKDFGGNND